MTNSYVQDRRFNPIAITISDGIYVKEIEQLNHMVEIEDFSNLIIWGVSRNETSLFAILIAYFVTNVMVDRPREHYRIKRVIVSYTYLGIKTTTP